METADYKYNSNIKTFSKLLKYVLNAHVNDKHERLHKEVQTDVY